MLATPKDETPESRVVGLLMEKENEIIAVASRFLMAQVLSEGAQTLHHDPNIVQAVRNAIGLVGTVREEILSFKLFLKADAAGLYPEEETED